MNYTEIKQAALDYADRQDAEVVNNMDTFLRVVEARANRILHVRKMATRAVIATVEDKEYYGLPYDFSGLRDIEIRDPLNPNSRETMEYLSPELMNKHVSSASKKFQYTIIADQLHVWPPSNGKEIEVVYYRKLPPLTEEDNENWLSTGNPDVYIFGLMVEINSFVKDTQNAMAWEQRFGDSIHAVTAEDDIDRWSGTPHRIRLA